MLKSVMNFVKVQKDAFVAGYHTGEQMVRKETTTEKVIGFTKEIKEKIQGSKDKVEKEIEKGTIANKLGKNIKKVKESLWRKWAEFKKDPIDKIGTVFLFTYGVAAKLMIYFAGAVVALLLGAPLFVAQLMLVLMMAHIGLDTAKAIRG